MQTIPWYFWFGLSLGLVLIGALILYCRLRKIKAKLPTVSTTTVHAVGISFIEPTKTALLHTTEERTVIIPSVVFPCQDAYNPPGVATAPDGTAHDKKKSNSQITRL
ncbi:Hypp5663 [Branchiostoma lanceolatum]|uniref:Hypp5663 protein n=1 Tax=Branchiostoma lanceolatum TaxID=7740 RepID=A0A8J9W739_BRALA|nr:Hypp5663 [Branchiostoma lanceolatum]